MPGTGWTPSIVPPPASSADQTVYLVVDSFGRLGTAYRETDIERTDLETTIGDPMSGHSMIPFASSPSSPPSNGRRMSQKLWPSKFKAAAILTVATFRKRSGTCRYLRRFWSAVALRLMIYMSSPRPSDTADWPWSSGTVRRPNYCGSLPMKPIKVSCSRSSTRLTTNPNRPRLHRAT